jgi:hypothetical protein
MVWHQNLVAEAPGRRFLAQGLPPRIATRYDRSATNFLAATVSYWL